MPDLFIIAEPNGAGKTTYARRFLNEELRIGEFVNADLIAAGLSPFAPEKAAFEAGRLMLKRLRDLAASPSRPRSPVAPTRRCCARCALPATVSGWISSGSRRSTSRGIA